MAKKTWSFELQDGSHTVVLKHAYLTGKRIIFIDDSKLVLPLSESRQYPDYGSIHEFQVAGHDCLVVISTNGITYSYDFILDGRSIETGEYYSFDPIKEEANRKEAEARATRLLILVMYPIMGLISLWFTWHSAFIICWPFYFIAFVGPVLIVFAVYYAIFPENPAVPPKPIPFRMWGAMIIAVGLGVLNIYLLDPEYFSLESILIAFGVIIFIVLYVIWLDKRYEKKFKKVQPYVRWRFDQIARDRLAEQLRPVFAKRDDEYQIPAVSLEEFFYGNDDLGSIAANLDPHPRTDQFYRILEMIRDRADVQDVLIGIQMLEDGNWPYSDILFIITSAKIATIRGWVLDLRPDATEFCKPSSDSFRPYPFPELNSDMRVAYIWWD